MSRPVVRPLLAAATLLAIGGSAPASAGTFVRQIPIGTWLDAQGNEAVSWFARSGPKPGAPIEGYFGAVDIGGGMARYYGFSFGFAAEGLILEYEKADGTAEIHVNVHFTNAITWAYRAGTLGVCYGEEPEAMFYGQFSGETPRPALSDGHIELKYIVTDPESPELDLTAAVLGRPGVVGIEQLRFTADGSGPLHEVFGVPDGTPGESRIQQVALFNTPGGGATADRFPPAERVDVWVSRGGDTHASATASRPEHGIAASRREQGAAASLSWGGLKTRYRGTRNTAAR